MCSVPIQLRHEACLIKNKLQTKSKWSRKLAAFITVVQGKADMRALVDSQSSNFQVYATGYGRYDLLDCHKSTC